MRAVVQPAYGSPDVLVLRDDVEVPPVADDGLLVRVRAASVNAGDWRQVRASPFLVRLGLGLRRPRTGAVGVDVAGEVAAVGKHVTAFRPGDAVLGMVKAGAFAEYATGGWFAPKPDGLTFEEAAALPAAGCTALQAVRDRARIRGGQRVLVNGAGGGVGTFVVQIARAEGADVTAVSRPSSLELLRSLGADAVLDYTREDFTDGSARYDVIVDLGGGLRVSRARRALAPGGTLVLVAAGRGAGGPVTRLLGAQVRSRLLKQRVVAFVASPAGFEENLRTLAALVDAGKVRPVVDRVYPLTEIADAIRHVESGGTRGKVVVRI